MLVKSIARRTLVTQLTYNNLNVITVLPSGIPIGFLNYFSLLTR